MTRAIPESARKMFEAMSYRMDNKPISDDRLETLIAWVQGHESSLDGFAPDFLNALLELQMGRRLRG